MATLALGVAGAWIGSSLPALSILGLSISGTTLGFTAGQLVGGLLFPSNQDVTLPSVTGPRLGEARNLSSAFGAPIPKPYGTARIAGNVIWAGPVQERKHVTVNRTSSGGKGFGGRSTTSQTVTTFTYDRDFALSIGEGPINGVRRIWADGRLIYNVAQGASLGSVLASQRIAQSVTVYPGDEAQLPDPLIEAHEGVGNVPAHRGMAYIVFSDFQLDDFGRRIPQLEVEVYAGGSSTQVGTLVATNVNTSMFGNGYAQHHGRINENGGVPLYHVLVHSTDKSKIVVRRWDAAVGTLTTGFEQYVLDLNHALADKAFDAAIHLAPARNFATKQVLIFSKTLETDPYVLVSNFDTTNHAGRLLYINLRSGRSVSLGYESTLNGITNACMHGRHLYVSIDSSPDFVVYFDLSAADDAVDGQLIFTAVSGNVTVNADSAGWWQTSGTGITWYEHGSGVTSGSHGSLTSGLAFRIDVSRDEFIVVTGNWVHINADGSTETTDISHIVDDTGSGAVQAAVDANSRNGQVFTARALFQNGNEAHYRWGTVTEGTPGSVTLSSIVNDLLSETDLVGGDFDVTSLAGTLVRGYVRTKPMTVRAAIEPLAAAFFFDGVESAGKIKFVPRGAGSVKTIANADLAAHSLGDEMPDDVGVTRRPEVELIRAVKILYYNQGRSFQQGTQYASRLITAAVNERTVEMPVVLTDDEARQVAERMLYFAWLERENVSASIGIKYIEVEPSDVVTVVGNNTTREIRVTEITHSLPNMLRVNGVPNDAAVLTSSIPGAAAEVDEETDIPVSGPTRLYLIDAPILRPADDFRGVYAVALGVTSGWNGAVVFRSSDDGATWDVADTLLNETLIARCATTLGDGSTTTWDRLSTLTIEPIDDQAPASSTDDDVLNGANTAVVGAPGRWEVLRFVNATDNGDGTYTLDRFVRGRSGTEHYTANHVAGDLFILLNANSASRIGIPSTDIGRTLLFRGVSIGSLMHESEIETLEFAGVGALPLSPVEIEGSRDGANNLTVTWKRRSRLMPRPLWVPQVGEDSESYELDVLDAPGGNVLRTIVASGETASYTAAQQTADGLTPGDPIDINIYQLSATVGRGTEGSATV